MHMASSMTGLTGNLILSSRAVDQSNGSLVNLDLLTPESGHSIRMSEIAVNFTSLQCEMSFGFHIARANGPPLIVKFGN